MSTARTKSSPLLTCDWSGTIHQGTGLRPEAIQAFSQPLVTARKEFLDDVAHFEFRRDVSTANQQMDLGFFTLPERMLQDYEARRSTSELQRILTTTRRFQVLLDRVVVVGHHGAYVSGGALMQSCAHPYHNELSRADRGGVPRVYFEGNLLDNDSTAGLLDLFGRGHPSQRIEDNWGIVVIFENGSFLATKAATHVYGKALAHSCAEDAAKVAERMITITSTVNASPLRNLDNDSDDMAHFSVPVGVGESYSVFSSAGLVPAAILGLDVVALLQGAASMNHHFRTAPPGNNRVLDFAAICHLLRQQRGRTTRVLSTWPTALEALARWYHHLLSESLDAPCCWSSGYSLWRQHGPVVQESLETQRYAVQPSTVTIPGESHRDRRSRDEGRYDRLVINLVTDTWRQDPLLVDTDSLNQDGLACPANRSLPVMLQAAYEDARTGMHAAGRPAMELRLPQVNEYFVGQLLQMLMVATVLEAHIMGSNRFGRSAHDV